MIHLSFIICLMVLQVSFAVVNNILLTVKYINGYWKACWKGFHQQRLIKTWFHAEPSIIMTKTMILQFYLYFVLLVFTPDRQICYCCQRITVLISDYCHICQLSNASPFQQSQYFSNVLPIFKTWEWYCISVFFNSAFFYDYYLG